jgi:xanthine/CO dehydrogenase XdhC/CoxF family maturation factor
MPRRLIVIGRGATAERIAELGGLLGYDELSVIEDLPDPLLDSLGPDDHLVVAEEDAAAAREHLWRAAGAASVPGYLGYAAPRREGWKALVGLAAKNLPKARIDTISAPAGVDVGAETPEEVAISVAAELVALRRGRALPSAGLELASPRRAAVEARPRRLVGGFARSLPEIDAGREEGEGEGEGEGDVARDVDPTRGRN